VLAMLIGLLESRAGTVGGDALATQANRDLVRLRIGTFDAPLRVRLVQANVVDDLALFIVEAPQESAGAEQAAKAAIRKSGESVCK